ncbi:MAG: hypothetical protein IJP17_02055, partial [Clostridia bacterium]|nr:hypothetical protein [Clostridia bacterium]
MLRGFEKLYPREQSPRHLIHHCVVPLPLQGKAQASRHYASLARQTNSAAKQAEMQINASQPVLYCIFALSKMLLRQLVLVVSALEIMHPVGREE